MRAFRFLSHFKIKIGNNVYFVVIVFKYIRYSISTLLKCSFNYLFENCRVFILLMKDNGTILCLSRNSSFSYEPSYETLHVGLLRLICGNNRPT